jgi:hypothetical protein
MTSFIRGKNMRLSKLSAGCAIALTASILAAGPGALASDAATVPVPVAAAFCAR